MGFTAIKFLLLVVALGVSVSAEVKFFFHSPSDSDVLHDLDIEIGHTSAVVLQANSVFTKDTNLSFVYEKSKSTHSDKLSYDLSSPTVKDGVTTWRLTMHAHNPGYVTFTLQAVNGSTHNYR
ncbi:hypothetical protein EB796_001779 [Bugula neritina]|uniref:Uncharacterized protein n=1 Tax=Bugula neritina TaxID=10212 RepID=A0A7J7KP39_BUGNE|nr:hypothetical protein EB796_001779 [Bugula neritina]